MHSIDYALALLTYPEKNIHDRSDKKNHSIRVCGESGEYSDEDPAGQIRYEKDGHYFRNFFSSTSITIKKKWKKRNEIGICQKR